jgi:NhaA family Na+:H+ antiporter
MGFPKLPTGVTWKQIFGVSVLGGIGFTMSIFITLLAFGQSEIIQSSKITILLTSLIAGLLGFFILYRVSKQATQLEE